MRIAIIGPGAMGLLYGAYLSEKNEVTLIGRSAENMEAIRERGVEVEEMDGSRKAYHPAATADPAGLEPFELVILFVKAGSSREALEACRGLIGGETLLMTLQNGAGHEILLQQYAPREHVLIGTTKEGSYRTTFRSICHSGKGSMAFGPVGTELLDREKMALQSIADHFNQCGFCCEASGDIGRMIWDKLMINASSSVLSGIFQTPQGYVAQNPSAWAIAKKLITELCETACAEGYEFRAEEQIERIHRHLLAAPGGYTSIYADLKARRKTEVDVINGAVVAAARRNQIAVPTHELIVDIVHGLEERAL